MSETISEQIEALKIFIVTLEAQRSTLGETVVEAALLPLREKLAELNQLLESSKPHPPEKPIPQRKLVSIY